MGAALIIDPVLKTLPVSELVSLHVDEQPHPLFVGSRRKGILGTDVEPDRTAVVRDFGFNDVVSSGDIGQPADASVSESPQPVAHLEQRQFMVSVGDPSQCAGCTICIQGL